jgi:hypothetical protein
MLPIDQPLKTALTTDRHVERELAPFAERKLVDSAEDETVRNIDIVYGAFRTEIAKVLISTIAGIAGGGVTANIADCLGKRIGLTFIPDLGNGALQIDRR